MPFSIVIVELRYPGNHTDLIFPLYPSKDNHALTPCPPGEKESFIESVCSGVVIVRKKTFFIVLIINLINFVGFLGIILPLIVGIPFGGLILPILVWIIILTLTFHDLHFIHNIIIGIIAYLATSFIVPYITILITG